MTINKDQDAAKAKILKQSNTWCDTWELPYIMKVITYVVYLHLRRYQVLKI